MEVITGAGNHYNAKLKKSIYGEYGICVDSRELRVLCDAVIAAEDGTKRTLTIKERLNKLRENTKSLKKTNSQVLDGIAKATVSSIPQKMKEREQI